MTSKANQKPYPFKTITERFLTTGCALTGTAIFGITAASLFPPVVLAMAGTYTIIGTLPVLQRWRYQRQIREGHIQKASADTPIYNIVKEINDSFGRKEIPQIYIMDRQALLEETLPVGLRWAARFERINKKIPEEAMNTFFAATIDGANIIITTEQAIAHMLSSDKKELRFIIGHEISHLKTDDLSLLGVSQALTKSVSKLLLSAATASLGISLALFACGVSLPIVPGVITAFHTCGLTLTGKLASDMALNLGLRIMEYRADRNSLYVTRDLTAAEDVMRQIHPPKGRPHSLYQEIQQTHPGYTNRMASLRQAFHFVSKYPQPRPDAPSAPQAQKPFVQAL